VNSEMAGISVKLNFDSECLIMITLDAEGQHGPREIPTLVKPGGR